VTKPRRRTFLSRNYIYVLSYNVDLEMSREEIGIVPGGVRVNIFATPDETRVYHALGERTVLENKAISGTIIWGGDWALIREDDIGLVDVKLTIRTDEDDVLDVAYRGIFPSGPRGFRRLVTEKPRLGSEKTPFIGDVYASPRFETASPRYRWLTERQCVGLGKVTIVDSTIRSATFDVYAMD
jgi:hypothetical protein